MKVSGRSTPIKQFFTIWHIATLLYNTNYFYYFILRAIGKRFVKRGGKLQELHL